MPPSTTASLVEAAVEDDRPIATPQRKPGIHSGFGPLLRRLHFYAGVFVAPFLFLVALTGLAYAFTPQIDQIAYHDKLYVTPGGSRMWWQRRPTRHRGFKLGAPPARGTWRYTDFALLFPCAAIAVAVGWAIPLLGLTLLGFLIIDAAVGLWKRAYLQA